MSRAEQPRVRGTTILAVRREGQLAVAGDGQVTVGDAVFKATAQKVRRLRGGSVLAGCSGGAADAMTLLEKLESRLEEYAGNLQRAAFELARDWRSDRVLRRLEAMLICGDAHHLLVVSGTGDLIVPDGDCVAIGSGGGYALAAARVLLANTELSAEQIARQALEEAAAICIYTNQNITVEVL